jgi:hypothetical protein
MVDVNDRDPEFQAAIERLHRVTVWGRWGFVLFLWLTIGALCLWQLRSELLLLQDHFTWVGVRYALSRYRLPGWGKSAIGLGVPGFGLGCCLAMTLSVLIWQSRNIIWGLPEAEQKRLHASTLKIHQQGPSHPLWRWVYAQAK